MFTRCILDVLKDTTTLYIIRYLRHWKSKEIKIYSNFLDDTVSFPIRSCNTLRRLSENRIFNLRRIRVFVLLILLSILPKIVQISPCCFPCKIKRHTSRSEAESSGKSISISSILTSAVVLSLIVMVSLRSKVSYITLMPGQVKDEFVDKLKVELGANKVGHGSGKCGTITNGIHWYVNVTLTPMWTNSHDITLR